MIDRIFSWLQEFLNYRINIVFAVISLLSSYFTVFKFLFKGGIKHLHTIKGTLLLVTILLLGLVIPVLILRNASWIGTVNIVLNIAAILGIVFLLFLLVIMYKMDALVKPGKYKMAKRQEALITLRQTHSFFDGQLHVHLIDQEWRGNPLRHQITAKIWSPGSDAVMLKRKSIGDTITHKGQGKYEIRIIAAAINEASFEVFSLN